MPSRKDESGENKPDSTRTSLRRLSSLASLHTLNPFNRRRSNNATDSPSSTSNLSLASTTAEAPHRHKNLSSSNINRENGNMPPPSAPPPLQPDVAARRSSYICLPDDPIGGMPRSRTLSNLPLPAKGKKSGNPLQQSKSHLRLPSALLPSTRIPSPPLSTRKHSVTRFTDISNHAINRKKLSRSDTEPLLHPALDTGGSTPRATAFKENITLSPIKPIPQDDWFENGATYSHPMPTPAYTSRHGGAHSRVASHAQTVKGIQQASSNMSLPRLYELPENGHKCLSQKAESSPIYRHSRERAHTTGQPVQRWTSQPVLTAQSIPRHPHGEIKQTRLMSTLPPPTPPRKNSPQGTEVFNRSTLRSSQTSGHLRKVSEQTTSRPAERLATRPRAPSGRTTAGTIHRAEPSVYWTGRFSALNDRYRNEDLSASIDLASPGLADDDWKPKSETDKIHSHAANNARMRRALEHLYNQCATDEARASFSRWQKQLSVALSMPELALPIGGRSCTLLEMSLKTDELDSSPESSRPDKGTGRKTSFFDRLMGKKARILAGGAA